jgi:hypothetical protein
VGRGDSADVVDRVTLLVGCAGYRRRLLHPGLVLTRAGSRGSQHQPHHRRVRSVAAGEPSGRE